MSKQLEQKKYIYCFLSLVLSAMITELKVKIPLGYK